MTAPTPSAQDKRRTAARAALRVTARAAFIAGVVLIALLSLGAPVGGGGGGADKLHHFIAYGAVSLFGLIGFRRAAIVAMFMIVLGGAIEIAQGTLTDNRSAEWGDMLANCLGVGAALAARFARRLF